MTSVFDRDDILFQVVVNHEEQYSIWPDYKAVPEGWRTVGKSGTGLTYRGYDIQELADGAQFEEVAYLLLNGEWKFNAIGQATTDPGLVELARRYM